MSCLLHIYLYYTIYTLYKLYLYIGKFEINAKKIIQRFKLIFYIIIYNQCKNCFSTCLGSGNLRFI